MSQINDWEKVRRSLGVDGDHEALDALVAERDAYRIEADKALHEIDDLEVEIQRLGDENERLRANQRTGRILHGDAVSDGDTT